MSARVTLIAGRHITAADKRNIVAVIQHLASLPPADRREGYYGATGSPKSYALLPDPDHEGRYAVSIKSRERDDYGRQQDRLTAVVVEVSGVPHLPAMVSDEAGPLFS